METENNQPQQKNIWSLIAGIAFIGIGAYRVYSHFDNEEISYSDFRFILALVFIVYGGFRIYNYLKAK